MRDKPFLKFIKENMFCVCCLRQPVDPHHVTSRGAGGGDEAENVVPLCREHHVEIHTIGRDTFRKKYPSFDSWMRAAGR